MTSAFYGADLAAIHAAGFTDLARRAAQELLTRLPAKATVVELGCGDGTSARALADAGHEVHGIDLSPHFVALARSRVPEGRFEVGSSRTAPLPRCHAVLAVGEVLGYVQDEGDGLGDVLRRCAAALEPDGILLFDLAGPGRPEHSTRIEGDGWAVESHTTVEGTILTRRIVTFRDVGGTRRRGEETHRLRLYDPLDVLATLRDAGFAGETLATGYGGAPMPAGVTAFVVVHAAAAASSSRST